MSIFKLGHIHLLIIKAISFSDVFMHSNILLHNKYTEINQNKYNNTILSIRLTFSCPF